MRRKKFFETYREAKKFLAAYKKQDVYGKSGNWNIYDLKKTHPRRVKTRYLVGSYFDWLDT